MIDAHFSTIQIFLDNNHADDFHLLLSGVAIGAGLQATVAIVNICCCYIIGLSIGIYSGKGGGGVGVNWVSSTGLPKFFGKNVLLG